MLWVLLQLSFTELPATTKSFAMRCCMTLYLNGYQRYEKSKLKDLVFGKYIEMFQIWPVTFLISIEVQGNTLPHWKALRSSKYEPMWQSYGSTLNICQEVWKVPIYYINRALSIFNCYALHSTIRYWIWASHEAALTSSQNLLDWYNPFGQSMNH